MPLWLLYLMLYLATLSGTWLVVKDSFPPVAVPRKALVRWMDKEPPANMPWPLQALHAFGRSVAYLFTCGFCMGFWVAIGVVFATAQYTSVPLPWLVIAACRILTGIAMSAYHRAEERWRLVHRQVWEIGDKYKHVIADFEDED